MSQRDVPDMPTMVVASLAASLMVDTASEKDPMGAFREAFQDCHDRAQELVNAVRPGAAGH
ncbi:hypothetical protein ILP92_08825 [Maribius pontilimi]|uniref:Uncharacterized protein n=2 Tax=Palleronia pontilimi TaxID=1964209 RepID=A0A934IE95_9RHOB|nr:hypothetical protein [Palleronia pontilimi]